jgi:hypothetical protein
MVAFSASGQHPSTRERKVFKNRRAVDFAVADHNHCADVSGVTALVALVAGPQASSYPNHP